MNCLMKFSDSGHTTSLFVDDKGHQGDIIIETGRTSLAKKYL